VTGISAISTRYAGCHFRSRLEARWAIFFDSLDIKWEYEPEGFETSVGWYLPDFRIQVPDDSYPYWFEVKPPGFDRDERHRVLCVETAMPTIVAKDIPRSYNDQLRSGASPLTAFLWGDRLDGAQFPADDAQPQCYSCAFVGSGHGSGSGFCSNWDAIHKARPFICSSFELTHIALFRACDCPDHDFDYTKNCDMCHGHYVPWNSFDVDVAYAAARSARFEHGQSGVAQ
jgi:hypothetical protein